jgi:hypothetical protein
MGAIALASGLKLIVCVPKAPDNTHRNPALQKPALDSTHSTKPTILTTASRSLEITQTTTPIFSSQFLLIPGFIPTAEQGYDLPLLGTISDIDISIRECSFFRCRSTFLPEIIRPRK